MAPTFSASRSCGPAGNSVHATDQPSGFSFSSRRPFVFRRTSVPYFWKPTRMVLSSAWPAVATLAAESAGDDERSETLEEKFHRVLPFVAPGCGVAKDDAAAVPAVPTKDIQ
jgi:hypothetical protein